MTTEQVVAIVLVSMTPIAIVLIAAVIRGYSILVRIYRHPPKEADHEP